MKILYVCSDPSISPGGRGGGFTTHMEEMIESLRRLGHEVQVLDTKSGRQTDPRAAGTVKGGTKWGAESEAGRGSDAAEEGTAEYGTKIESAQEKRSQETRTPKTRDRKAGRMPRALRVILRDSFYLLHNIAFYSKLSSLLKAKHDFDFVYERYYLYQYATSLAARRWDIPLILEFNASIEEFKLTDGLGLRPLADLVEKFVTRRADAVITVSGVLKKYLAGRGVPSERVYVMHNGVNLSKFRPEMSGDRIRQEFGLMPSDIVVGFVGGFSVWHGAHLLLEVAPLAVQDDKRIRFFMVGGREGNPRFESFKKAADDKALSEMFRFAGEVPRENVPEYIAAMDIAVIPWATDYGSPTKTFEYMGMAKALVGPRVAALEEVLTDEQTALIVRVSDAAEMARAIVRLARDADLRRRLGANARRAVEEKYNWDHNAASTIEIVERLNKRRVV